MRIAPLSAAGVPLLQRALREPLLHFLLLGGLLFGVPGEPTADQQRVVDPGRLAALQGNVLEAWRRAPTGEELEGLCATMCLRKWLCVRRGRWTSIGLTA